MVLATVKAVTVAAHADPASRWSTVDLTDGSGYLRVTFFNQPWRERQLPAGHEHRASSARSSVFQGRRQMTNPVVDLVGDKTGRIVADLPAVGEGRRR